MGSRCPVLIRKEPKFSRNSQRRFTVTLINSPVVSSRRKPYNLLGTERRKIGLARVAARASHQGDSVALLCFNSTRNGGIKMVSTLREMRLCRNDSTYPIPGFFGSTCCATACSTGPWTRACNRVDIIPAAIQLTIFCQSNGKHRLLLVISTTISTVFPRFAAPTVSPAETPARAIEIASERPFTPF